jgi:protein-tyrosine phosphatase
MDGTPASLNACDVIAERGLDLLKHRARRIHVGILAAHDAILCMTRSQREALQVQFPEHARRIHLFSQMVGRTYDVPDPYGLEREVYVSTANELADLVRRGGAKIVDLVQAPR